jgi:segregation and condensation protein B
MDKWVAVLEALVFASDTPLSLERIAETLKGEGLDRKALSSLLERLKTEYEARDGGICLEEVAGGYQFRTRPEMSSWIRRLKASRPALLSPAALETLAIVAYRQPVVKGEIDRVRGVDVGGVLRSLLERKMVRMVGRKDAPGKPILYGTTKKFLEVFQLRDLSELPTLREFHELQKGYEQGVLLDVPPSSADPGTGLR